jgi:hypothetical protein
MESIHKVSLCIQNPHFKPMVYLLIFAVDSSCFLKLDTPMTNQFDTWQLSSMLVSNCVEQLQFTLTLQTVSI